MFISQSHSLIKILILLSKRGQLVLAASTGPFKGSGLVRSGFRCRSGGLAGRSGLGYDLCEEPPGFSLTCFDCCLIRSDTSLSGPPAFPSDAARRTSCQAALVSLCWDVRRSPGRDFFFSCLGAGAFIQRDVRWDVLETAFSGWGWGGETSPVVLHQTDFYLAEERFFWFFFSLITSPGGDRSSPSLCVVRSYSLRGFTSVLAVLARPFLNGHWKKSFVASRWICSCRGNDPGALRLRVRYDDGATA